MFAKFEPQSWFAITDAILAFDRVLRLLSGYKILLLYDYDARALDLQQRTVLFPFGGLVAESPASGAVMYGIL